MDWAVRGSNAGEDEDPTSLLYKEYRVSSPEVKRPERGLDYAPISSAEVKERVDLYLYPRSGPSWRGRG